MIVLYSFLASACFICLFFSLYYLVKYIVEKISEWVYRRKKVQEDIEDLKESIYILTCKSVETAFRNIARTNNLESDISKLSKEIKKLKGVKK